MTNPTPNIFARYLDGDVPVEELHGHQACALAACAEGYWVRPHEWGYWRGRLCPETGRAVWGEAIDHYGNWERDDINAFLEKWRLGMKEAADA